MSKYSTDFKLKIVQHYLRSQEGFERTAARFGVDKGAIRRWVAAYEHHGRDGLVKPQAHFDAEFKMSVLEWLNTGHGSIRQACARFNVRSISRPVRILSN